MFACSIKPVRGRVNVLSVVQTLHYSKDVNILDKMKEYPSIMQFMSNERDSVKDKWETLYRYREECLIDPNIDIGRFFWIRQQYELFSLHNESEIDQNIVDSDTFLSQIKTQTADPNSKPLTLKQFEATKKRLNVLKFQKIIDQIMQENRNILEQLCRPYTLKKHEYLHKQLSYWTTYHHGSYGHPYITEIYDNLMKYGNVDASHMLDILYYVQNLQDFKWNFGDDNNLKHYKYFLITLQFFRKNDMRIEDDEFFIWNSSRSLRHTLRLKEFWTIQTERYFNLCQLISDIVKIKKIKTNETQLTKYIVSLYHMDNDPFFKFLWNSLSDKHFEHTKEDLKQRIYNRWNMDIMMNGLLIEKY
eukprot:139924_1